MSTSLDHSIFSNVFFPKTETSDASKEVNLDLQRILRFQVAPSDFLRNKPMVVFDFETTGLNSFSDKIIEIGAQKILNGEVIEEFETFIDPQMSLSKQITQLTGITNEDLIGQPLIEKALPEFLSFIDGSILVAHNADFDISFLKASAKRIGIEIDWPALCTLKLARVILKELESKKLGSIADFYGVSYDGRAHRSIVDVKVTVQVLEQMLSNEGEHLLTWQDFAPFHSV